MADAWLCEVLAMLGSQGLVNDPGAAGTSWAGAAVGQKDMKQEGLVPLPCLPRHFVCQRSGCLGEKFVLWHLFSTARMAATSPPIHLCSSSLSASICLVTTHWEQHCQPALQQPPSFNLCHCPLAYSFQTSWGEDKTQH